MADVEIKYNNATIASLDDSGTEVLETKGTFLTDDITVEYTKSGGGGSTPVSFNLSDGNFGYAYYIDSNGTYNETRISPPDPMMGGKQFSQSVKSGTLITAVITTRYSSITYPTNCTVVKSIDNGKSGTYKTILIIQAN